MTTIHATDTIFATAVSGNATVATVHSTGFTSMADIITYIRLQKATLAGLVTIHLRNASQGWHQTSAVYLS